MGWIKGDRRPATVGSTEEERLENGHALPGEENRLSGSVHDGPVSNDLPATRRKTYPSVSVDTPDDELPFIPKEEVMAKRQPGMLARGKEATAKDARRRDWWIVVDDIVYDCTDFVLEHPGGQQVVMSFVGEDCSWQFWRFHRRKQLEEYGLALRVGRTEGVPNRFREPKRFVGLSRLGRDEC